MLEFKNYDNAVAKHHKDLQICNTPISSWNFHYNLINDLKNVFIDTNKLEQMAIAFKWQKNWDSKTQLSEEVIIVTDLQSTIVFASHNITKMNGYLPHEVVGKSPSLFQGQKTSAVVSKQIGKAIALKQPFEKTVINYKKNGQTYLCLIKGFPVYNYNGELSHFIAFEKAA